MSLRDRIATRAIQTGLRLSFKLPSRLPLPAPLLRGAMDAGAKLFPVRRDVLIEHCRLGGVPGLRLTPEHGGNGRVLLHFHGGAFFAGSSESHRALASELAARCGLRVQLLDYRLAPEHRWPAALDDGLAAWQALRDQGVAARDIILGGDSGGCAHILALALLLRERGDELPGALVMISPYVDLSLSMPSVARNRRRDPMVTAEALRRGGDAYRGALDVRDPRVSPLFADLAGLPPTLIQAGSEEILLDDARALGDALRQAGVPCDISIWPGLWHNFQMFHGRIRAADEALDAIARFVREDVVAAAHAG